MTLERWLHVLRMRLQSIVRGRALDHELDDELQFHLEHAIDERVARGMPIEEARRQALAAIGGLTARREEIRDTRRLRLAHDLWQDVRYALRTLAAARPFTLASLLTLALGIGGSVAMFTVVNGVLLRPLPFPEPDRLFAVAMSQRSMFVKAPMLSDHNYVALRDRSIGLAHLATYSTSRSALIGVGDPDVIAAAAVTADFFPALGVAPALGRAFLREDEQTGREQTIVLGSALWRSKFGGHPGVIGQTLVLDGVRRVIVGVMPDGFQFPGTTVAWIPKNVALSSGNSFLLPVFGRLAPGVTIDEARARFEAMLPALPHAPPADRTSWEIGLLPLADLLVGDVGTPMRLFAGAVLIVLLIACANVASLMLTRGAHRHREIATRTALGASRARIVRQLLTESTLLALAGGTLGLALAQWGVTALLGLAPEGRIPRESDVVLDWRVIGFAIGISLATAALFGLGPALRVTRSQRSSSLLPGSRAFGAGQERLRAVLAVGQIALALVLLTGAGLLIKSFVRLRAVDSGFDTRNVIAMNVQLPDATYGSAEALQAFHHQLLERLRTLPGVSAAGVVNWMPLGTMHLHGDYRIEGRQLASDPYADKPAVSDGYFEAMRIPLLRGRTFDQRDTSTSLPVAIVSRSVAKVIDPSGTAVGSRISVKSSPTPRDWLTVVGVVEDVTQWGPAKGPRPAIYQLYAQVQQAGFLNQVYYVVRTSTDPRGVVPLLRPALLSVDPKQPATSVALMDDVAAMATAEPRFHARLLTVFALAAFALAIVGTYGVLAYSVAQRLHEIGVRIALGAGSGEIVRMILTRTVILGVVGIGLGLTGAAFATTLLKTFLFQTTTTDPATFAGVTLLILASAVAAGLVPAARASRVDPLVILRHE
jgi:predicted permease